MQPVLAIATSVAGAGVVVGTWSSVLRTLVIPRGLSSKLTLIVSRAVAWPFGVVADRIDSYDRRDSVLAAQASITLLALLLTWLALFMVGFALLLWALNGGTAAAALRESGSAIFTLGFAAARSPSSTALHFLAAVTGLVVVALQIGYLPTLYSAFARRETLVTMLESRAGLPAWGPEILARHQTVQLLDNLPQFYADWERWAADVTESHSNYPALIHFRSPEARRSWLVGLLSVLDSAALYLALCPMAAPTEARLCLRMGFTALRNLCDAVRIPYDPDPMPDTPISLTYEEFLNGVGRMQAVAFPIERSPEEAWPHFRGWRTNYEANAYALADLIEAVPALWSGPRKRGTERMSPYAPLDRRPDDPEGRRNLIRKRGA